MRRSNPVLRMSKYRWSSKSKQIETLQTKQATQRVTVSIRYLWLVRILFFSATAWLSLSLLKMQAGLDESLVGIRTMQLQQIGEMKITYAHYRTFKSSKQLLQAYQDLLVGFRNLFFQKSQKAATKWWTHESRALALLKLSLVMEVVWILKVICMISGIKREKWRVVSLAWELITRTLRICWFRHLLVEHKSNRL